ncbi:response regulator transcription factor [Streptomyces poriticola]|uniref:response regulator transcription factor n=1 Tax=Streptomyces poriticola TaxID=3120506 RepID=UPI002FCE3F83
MRLLLVEDENHVAAAVSAILTRHGFTVVHASSGWAAMEALMAPDSDPFDVILLDLGLPDQDGYEVCGRIRRWTGTPVIMVTARADIRSRVHGLDRGADDYVVKPFNTRELIARIHAVSRRAAAAEGGDVRGNDLLLGPVRVDLTSRQVRVDGSVVHLTRKEFDLLALLGQRPGVVFRREQIISEVWESRWEGAERTLQVHVASLRAKLRTPELIGVVRGVGYRLVLPER